MEKVYIKYLNLQCFIKIFRASVSLWELPGHFKAAVGRGRKAGDLSDSGFSADSHLLHDFAPRRAFVARHEQSLRDTNWWESKVFLEEDEKIKAKISACYAVRFGG